MKICFLTKSDPEDKRSWSGIYYNMYINLKKTHEVEWIGKVRFALWQSIILNAQYFYNKIVVGKIPLHNSKFSRFYAQKLKTKLANNNYELIFAPVSSGLICYLDTAIPIVYLSDTTFQLMVNYYQEFTNLNLAKINKGNEIEKKALNNASKVIFSSQWAKKSAIDFYSVSPEKIFVSEFGANLLYEPCLKDLNFDETEICNILFLGVDWERKGGQKAYETYLELRRRGFKCTFTIIGCNPKLALKDAGITILPFINKNNKQDFDKLYKILLQTHILLLPTKAECFGIVFCEASAFGIPSIATKTGGISSAIKEGLNGYLIDMNENEKKFADKIFSIFTDKEAFKKLRLSTRVQYESRLNWSVWVENFNKLIQDL